MAQTRVSYRTMMTEGTDEAESLSGYLNEHGVFAIVSNGHEVSVACEDTETFELLSTLQTTWQRFWDNSDSGLFGLPMFIKEN
jgi:hypothetical protein